MLGNGKHTTYNKKEIPAAHVYIFVQTECVSLIFHCVSLYIYIYMMFEFIVSYVFAWLFSNLTQLEHLRFSDRWLEKNIFIIWKIWIFQWNINVTIKILCSYHLFLTNEELFWSNHQLIKNQHIVYIDNLFLE